jgi:hypothetical protein
MNCTCPVREFEADTNVRKFDADTRPLKLQHLKIEGLHRNGNVPKHTPTHEITVAFDLP